MAEGEVDKTLEVASICPFCNFLRTRGYVNTDSDGNVHFEEMAEAMVKVGYGKYSSFFLAFVTAKLEPAPHFADCLNLCEILNSSIVKHPGDLSVISPERAKVDFTQLDHICRRLEHFSDRGVVDYATWARVENECFVRDWGKIVEMPQDAAGWQRVVYPLVRFFAATVVASGEVAVWSQLFAGRERVWRTRLITVEQFRRFVVDAEAPKGWLLDRCSLTSTGINTLVLLGFRAAAALPGRLLPGATTTGLKAVTSVFFAISHRIECFFIKKDRGYLVDREELANQGPERRHR